MPESSLERLRFPVVGIRSNDPMVYFFAQAAELETTSEQLLGQGVFRGVEFVDTTGRVFTVKHVHKTGYRGLWGWNPLRKGRQVSVRFTLQENDLVALEAFKQTLSAQVLASPHTVNRADLLRAVRDAANFHEIIRLFK